MSVRFASADPAPSAPLTTASVAALACAALAAAAWSGSAWLSVLSAAVAISGVGVVAWWLPRRQREPVSEQELTGPPEGEDPDPAAPVAGGCFLYTAESLHEAQLVLDTLADGGIEATVFNQHLIGAMGELPVSQCWPKIWLADATNHEAARAIVEGYEARKRVISDATRRCGACGEESPDNFEVCWSCRTPFEA